MSQNSDDQLSVFPDPDSSASGPQDPTSGPDLSNLPDRLLVGTSSFSNEDWRGRIYPESARPGEFLVHYARWFRTVEIDATFYAEPSPRTVDGWAAKVPDGFVISAKVPRVITHDRRLLDCHGEFDSFRRTMARLGEKQGPLLFQFPYVSQRRDPEEHATGKAFTGRLARFLDEIPADDRYVVEVRNANWIDNPLLDVLRRHHVSLALTHYYTMPPPKEALAKVRTLPGDIAYVRFLGDHRQMDRLVATAMKKGARDREWGEILVDRSQEVASTIPVLRDLLRAGRNVFVYFNNHYAGYAPGSIAQFARQWQD
jgi:uncharacterized protein YecE (DUF72 family)